MNYGSAYIDRITGSLASDRSEAMRMLGRHPVNLGTAIGRVVAHEVGHFLFQIQQEGHTPSGLMRAQFRGDSRLFLGGGDWGLSRMQRVYLNLLIQRCRQQNSPITTNPTPIITTLPGGPGGSPEGGPIGRWGGGDPFDVFRWLDLWMRSNGGYGEVVDYEIGELVP